MRKQLQKRPGGSSRRTFLRVAGATTLGSAVLAGRAIGHGGPEGDGVLHHQVSLVTEESGGKPEEIGIELEEEALTDNIEGNDNPLEEVGDRAELEIPDSFPGNFEHVGAWYNPDGHPPPGVYTVPHFDVHCYTIPIEEKRGITGSPLFGGTDVPTPLPPDQLPPKYVPDHSVVPEMGLHWFDTTAPEFGGGSFSHTNIYGSYEGELTFVEPMVTTEFLSGLDDGETVSKDIATPDRYPEAGHYPTGYTISYDADGGENGGGVYRIVLTEFESFEASEAPI